MLVTFGDETPGADQVDAGLGGLVRFGQSWLALQYFNYQHIVASGVDARLLSVTGGGIRLAHNRWCDLITATGITLQKERADNGTVGDLQTELPIYLDFKLGIPERRLGLDGTAAFYQSLSIGDRRRIDGRLKLDLGLVGNLTIGLQALYNHDTQPLDQTKDKTNRSLSLNVGYKF